MARWSRVLSLSQCEPEHRQLDKIGNNDELQRNIDSASRQVFNRRPLRMQ